jgi:hypothetical protein
VADGRVIYAGIVAARLPIYRRRAVALPDLRQQLLSARHLPTLQLHPFLGRGDSATSEDDSGRRRVPVVIFTSPNKQ